MVIEVQERWGRGGREEERITLQKNANNQCGRNEKITVLQPLVQYWMKVGTARDAETTG